MRRLLSLCILWALLPCCALAATLPYPADTVLSVLDLTPAQQALADALYLPVFNGREEITLPENTRYEDASIAMQALMQDYPELFHLGRDYTLTYYAGEPEYAISVKPGYRMSAGEAAAARSVLYAQAYLLADAQPDPLALHDTLCALVHYGGETETRHTAVGALLEGRATCEGYAQALTLLYRMAGIPCGVVTGEATDSAGSTQRHSWVIADLDGCTLIDPTWNDQDGLGLNTHWYYGLSDSQMGRDHTPDGHQRLPACGSHANWHAAQGCVISSPEDMDEALRRLVREGEVNLRFADGALFAPWDGASHDLLADYNRRWPGEAFYGAYSITLSLPQQCLIITREE